MRLPIRKLAMATAVISAAAVGTWEALRPRALAWGATWDEVVRPLPGEDLVDNPLYVTTRAITIAAPAAAVWPWVVQIGQNRGGFYSYDLLENLTGLDIHSADTVHPEWQDLRVGQDFVTLDRDGVIKMTVTVFDPQHAFVLRSGAPGEEPQEPGDLFKGEIEWSWSFVLVPVGPGTTRLLVRSRGAWADTASARAAVRVLLEPIHLIMEERMLRGIRERAQRAAG